MVSRILSLITCPFSLNDRSRTHHWPARAELGHSNPRNTLALFHFRLEGGKLEERRLESFQKVAAWPRSIRTAVDGIATVFAFAMQARHRVNLIAGAGFK